MKRENVLRSRYETGFRILLALVLAFSLMPTIRAFAEGDNAEPTPMHQSEAQAGGSEDEIFEDAQGEGPVGASEGDAEDPGMQSEPPETDLDDAESVETTEDVGSTEPAPEAGIALLSEEGGTVEAHELAPRAETTLVINTSSQNVLWNNLEAVLKALYPTSSIAEATTLKFTGSGTIAMGSDQSTVSTTAVTQSVTYLNSLAIDTLDLSEFTGKVFHGTFANARNITTVALGSAVTELPGAAFSRCVSLTALSDTLENAQANPGVIDLGKTGVSGLTSVWDPYSLVVGNQFNECANFHTLTLGNAIKVIPYHAFFRCESLTTISNDLANAQINQGVADFEKTGVVEFHSSGEQFSNCSSLTTVTLGKKILSLPTRAFASCVNLDTISDTLANARSEEGQGVIDLEKTGITSLGDSGNQFRLCTSIKAVTLGTQIPTLPPYVFQGCTYLAAISDTLANVRANPGVYDLEKTGVTSLAAGGGQFETNYYYHTLTLGTAIPSIPYCAFRGAASLTTVSDTLANAQGISKGLLDMDRVPAFEATGSQFIDASRANVYMGASSQPLVKSVFTRVASVFVPKTLSTVTVEANAFAGSTKTKLFVKGPQAASPTTLVGEANIAPAALTYYYEASTSTDGNGTIERAGGGFLPAAVEAREVAAGNLASGSNYVEESEELTYTIIPNANYAVGTITANGVPVAPVGVSGYSYTFAGVTEDTHFHVTFNAMRVTYDDANSTGSTYEHPTFYSAGDSVTALAYDDPALSSFAEPLNKGFSHWNTMADDSGTSYQAGDTFAFAGPTTLYAVYANLYKVEYDDNGGDGSNVPPDDTGLVDGSTHILNSTTIPTHAVDAITNEDVVFIGWTEGAADTHLYTKDETAPTTVTSVTISGADATVYAVWGLDVNKNGVPDVKESKYSVTYHLVDTAGSDIAVAGIFEAPAQETGLLAGTWSAAVTAPNGTAQNRTYVGWNTDGSGTPVNTGAISTQISGNTDVYLVYRSNSFPVTVSYRHKDGTALTGPNQDATMGYGAVFVPIVPVQTDLCLVDWTLNGVSQNNTAPSVAVIAAANIVLVYGQDKNHDGKEDVTVTENCYCTDGTHLNGPHEVYVNVGDTYRGTPSAHAGHTYASYSVDAGPSLSGDPRIDNIAAAADVRLTYTHNAYAVDVRHVDANGSAIGGGHDYSQMVAYQDSWSVPAGAISGYDYQGWRIGNGPVRSGNPLIPSVTGDTTLYLVYKAQAGPTPPLTPDPENYDFVKKPNVKSVSAGETVGYTFASFGNRWPHEVQRYSITDKPDRGLDFVSASLPAFAQGSGVAYDVVYYTSGGAEVVLYSGVSAASAFSFTAPALAPGEYITAIELDFGTVPAGFGVGDTIDMTFKVWDNPPAKTLTNVGILFYGIGDKDYGFVTGEDGMIVIGGWFSDLVQTGDGAAGLAAILAALVGASAIAINGFRKRRRRA